MLRFRPGRIGLQLLGFGYQRIENYVPDPQEFTGKPPVTMRSVRRRQFNIDAKPAAPRFDPPAMPDFGLRRTAQLQQPRAAEPTPPLGAPPRPARPVATPQPAQSVPQASDSDDEDNKTPPDLLRILEAHRERAQRKKVEKANEPPPKPTPPRPKPPKGLMEEKTPTNHSYPPVQRAETPIQRRETPAPPQVDPQPEMDMAFDPDPADMNDFEPEFNDLPQMVDPAEDIETQPVNNTTSDAPVSIDPPAPQAEPRRTIRRQRVTYNNEPDRRRAAEPETSPPQLEHIESEEPVSNETIPIVRRKAETQSAEPEPSYEGDFDVIEQPPVADVQHTETIQAKPEKSTAAPDELTELPKPEEPAQFSAPEPPMIRRKPRSSQQISGNASGEPLADVWRSMVTKHLMPVQRNSEMTSFGLPLLDDEIDYQTEQIRYDTHEEYPTYAPDAESGPPDAWTDTPSTEFPTESPRQGQSQGSTDSPSNHIARQADFPTDQPDGPQPIATDEFIEADESDWYDRSTWDNSTTDAPADDFDTAPSIERGNPQPPVFQQTESTGDTGPGQPESSRGPAHVQRQPADDLSDFVEETFEPVPAEATPPSPAETITPPTNGRNHRRTRRGTGGFSNGTHEPVQRQACTEVESTPDHIQRTIAESTTSNASTGDEARPPGESHEDTTGPITEHPQASVLDNDLDERPAVGAESDLLQLLQLPSDTPIVGRKPQQSIQRVEHNTPPRQPDVDHTDHDESHLPQQTVPLDQALLGMTDTPKQFNDEPIQRAETAQAPSQSVSIPQETPTPTTSESGDGEGDEGEEDGINMDKLTREVFRRLRSKLRSDQDRRSGN